MNKRKKTGLASRPAQRDIANPSPRPTSRAVGAIGPIPSADRKTQNREKLDQLFREHVQRWKTATRHWSSVNRMFAHPSYLRIIGLAGLSAGSQIERLLLEELEAEPDYWFDALTAITGEDPVQPDDDFDESVNAWLEWGREKGILIR